jgi:hypothetical protein
MAPPHRLAIGLSDQGQGYIAAIRSTSPVGNYVGRVKELPRSGLVQSGLSRGAWGLISFVYEGLEKIAQRVVIEYVALGTGAARHQWIGSG